MLPLLQDADDVAVHLSASGVKGKLVPIPVVDDTSVRRSGRGKKPEHDDQTQLTGGSWQPGVHGRPAAGQHSRCAWVSLWHCSLG